MSGDVRAIRTDARSLSDLHACLDQAIAEGASAGVLIIGYPDSIDDWEAFATDGMTRPERAFIYQQLIFIETMALE